MLPRKCIMSSTFLTFHETTVSLFFGVVATEHNMDQITFYLLWSEVLASRKKIKRDALSSKIDC